MKLPLVVKPDVALADMPAGVILVDVRSAADYTAGHLPSAIHLDPGLLNRSNKPVGGLLPDITGMNAIAMQIGLHPDSHIVVYDNGGETAAARLVWVLHAYGFDAVSWLDGGLAARVSSGAVLDTVVHKPASANSMTFDTPAGQSGQSNVLGIAALQERLGEPQVAIVDTRSPAEFAGSDVRSARGGRIPGAVNYVWTDALDEHHKTLKSDDELLEAMRALDVNKSDEVIVYCQTHQRSAVTYVMLKHLGYDNVLALDGAWSAWGNDPDTPVETG